MGRPLDPLVAFNFNVEIDGLPDARFKSVEGIEKEIVVIEWSEAGDIATARKVPGKTKFPNVTLVQGMSAEIGATEWQEEIFRLQAGFEQTGGRGNAASFRRTITITQHDKSGRDIIRYTLYSCWITKWSLDTLDAESDDQISTVKLEVAYEGFDMELLNDAIVPINAI